MRILESAVNSAPVAKLVVPPPFTFAFISIFFAETLLSSYTEIALFPFSVPISILLKPVVLKTESFEPREMIFSPSPTAAPKIIPSDQLPALFMVVPLLAIAILLFPSASS